MTQASWVQAVFRSGSNSARDVRVDLFWLLGLALLLVATGIGVRDPWPADEPRFALIVRDMVASGEWLLPHVGGDVYADKPPLYFWMMGVALLATGSLRIAFLLPSLLSGLACLFLIYDLGRRLWNREAGLAAAFGLLLTVQFVWQVRQAQIDATLLFWVVLGLYGLLRHLLQGPAWGWYTVGWAASGFGVITKGVGFLPLLILIPFALMRGWSPRAQRSSMATWFIGPLAFLLAVSTWLVPMLLAASEDPSLAAYRDEILFRQTMHRYTDAWHHREPFWYFIVEVIPVLWLPLTLLLPWLVPRWREAWQARDLRVGLLLSWVVLVVLFFSFSSGKRGLYILPALPALALVSGPYLTELMQRRGVQRAISFLTAGIAAVCLLAAAFVLIRPERRHELLANYDLDVLGPLLLIGGVGALICAVARLRHAPVAYAGLVGTTLLTVSYWINPAMNESRSGAAFIGRVERFDDRSAELGFVGFKEQYLLNVHRPIVHFGHARWREVEQEAADAARWMSGRENRQLVVNAEMRALCFADAVSTPLGRANRSEWYIVRGKPNSDCVARGREAAAYHYAPPASITPALPAPPS
ncbi:glycosyltransferase family 39 protein [Steroidobacter sp. S1-65]|uniref:Glycosyltransferase family 39 protein n=1 Tax=Steroidobacter gossypii TaxID=2805490 RepID=A0ABS1X3F6_9GAMM|nr:glycosyltransferase family 39 protein [Steroidobacter gossypii]MBM0107737.1 glycosyltransferase family 39 protein [Steroidobacter gossypii]